jgi:hypothetical protein
VYKYAQFNVLVRRVRLQRFARILWFITSFYGFRTAIGPSRLAVVLLKINPSYVVGNLLFSGSGFSCVS